jgi:hypothetical protein
MLLIRLCVFCSFLFGAMFSQACPAMQASTTALEQIVKKADIVVVGRRLSDSFASADHGSPVDKPEFIFINVDRVLKGKIKEKVLTVKSWDGMCSYGVIMNPGNVAVLSLRFFTTTDPKDLTKTISYYVPVEPYNEYTNLHVIKDTKEILGNIVKVDNKVMSIDDLIKEYRLK